MNSNEQSVMAVFIFAFNCQNNLSSFTFYISIDLYAISVYTYICKQHHYNMKGTDTNDLHGEMARI